MSSKEMHLLISLLNSDPILRNAEKAAKFSGFRFRLQPSDASVHGNQICRFSVGVDRMEAKRRAPLAVNPITEPVPAVVYPSAIGSKFKDADRGCGACRLARIRRHLRRRNGTRGVCGSPRTFPAPGNRYFIFAL